MNWSTIVLHGKVKKGPSAEFWEGLDWASTGTAQVIPDKNRSSRFSDLTLRSDTFPKLD